MDIKRWLPTTTGHGHSPLNITCPVCHKQQSSDWTCPVVVCDTFVYIRELVVTMLLVSLLFAPVDYTRDLAVVNWTCPVVVCDISCGHWDLSRCCLQPIGLVPLLFATFRLY